MNLLPQELKEENRKIYHNRLLVWWLLFVLLFILVSITLLVPSYLALSSKRVNVEKTLVLARAHNEASSAEASYTVVAEVNKKILTLSQKKGATVVPSAVLDTILAKRPLSVRLTNIRVEPGSRISLEGVADTREALTSFKDSLGQNGMFKDVNSPISNLIAERDIKFSITAAFK